MKTSGYIIFFTAAVLWYGCNSKPGKKPGDAETKQATLTLAAASDLKFAMDSMVSVFQAGHPAIKVSVIYGSSGKFFQQISKEAPFDIFFSADVAYAKKLDQMGLTAGRPASYAIGRIVLWSNKINTQQGMTSLLDDRINKIAIANPAHAPYGKRAEEALKHYAIYEQVKQKLIMGENISQTAQYVLSGAAEAGIIALSLALSPAFREHGNYFLIPDNAHLPLEQAYVVLKKAAENRSAVLFTEFISSGQAKDVLKKYGFTLPD